MLLLLLLHMAEEGKISRDCNPCDTNSCAAPHAQLQHTWTRPDGEPAYAQLRMQAMKAAGCRYAMRVHGGMATSGVMMNYALESQHSG